MALSAVLLTTASHILDREDVSCDPPLAGLRDPPPPGSLSGAVGHVPYKHGVVTPVKGRGWGINRFANVFTIVSSAAG